MRPAGAAQGQRLLLLQAADAADSTAASTMHANTFRTNAPALLLATLTSAAPPAATLPSPPSPPSHTPSHPPTHPTHPRPTSRSLRTTLCLQYPPRAIAMAALFSARLVLRLPSPQPSFFQQHNINAAYVKDIVDQLWRTYRVHAEASGVLQLSSPVGSLSAADGRLQLQEPLPRAEVGPKAEGGATGNGHPGQPQQAQQYGYGTQQQAVAG